MTVALRRPRSRSDGFPAVVPWNAEARGTAFKHLGSFAVLHPGANLRFFSRDCGIRMTRGLARRPELWAAQPHVKFMLTFPAQDEADRSVY